jgi:hypothetical protein
MFNLGIMSADLGRGCPGRKPLWVVFFTDGQMLLVRPDGTVLR